MSWEIWSSVEFAFSQGEPQHLIPNVMPLLSTQIAPHVWVKVAVIEGHLGSRKDVMDVASTL